MLGANWVLCIVMWGRDWIWMDSYLGWGLDLGP